MRRRLFVTLILVGGLVVLAGCGPAATGAGSNSAGSAGSATAAGGPTGRMLVALAEAGRVAAVDLARGQVVDVAEVVPNVHGAALTPGNKFLVTTSMGQGTTKVGLVDPITLQVSGQVETGSSHHTAPDPKGRYVYVTAMPDELIAFDRDGQVAKRVKVGKGPYFAAAAPDGKWVYVTLQGASALAVVDADTLELAKTFPLAGGPNHAVVSPDGSRVYVSLVTGQALAEVDAATGKVNRTFPLGAPGHGVGITGDGRTVYVSSLEGNLVALIDTAGGQVTKRPTPGMPNHIERSPDGRFMLVTLSEAKQILVFDATTHAVVKTIDIGYPPHQMAFLP